LVIPQFLHLATASTATFGGDSVVVFTVQEDVDEIAGEPLEREARRVAHALVGEPGR
jgi:hypothetical protein